MFTPTNFLQNCTGISIIVLSIGGTWALGAGAWVQVSVGKANISVSRKLQKVEQVARKVEDTVEDLKNEPSVSPLKVKGLEAELKDAEAIAVETEAEIEQDLENIANPHGM